MSLTVPVVSVLMPVYNAALYVEESINSILNQTFDDFELIIFNDGSTDDSAKIIQNIKDTRIVFVNSIENIGYVAHLNHGLQLARGKYIARMDADDISLPDRFEKQILFLDNNPDIGLCGTRYLTFGAQEMIASLPEKDEAIREYLLRNSPIAHPSVIFRKALIEKYELYYDRSFMPAEDYKLWYDFSKITKLYNIPDILLHYRLHSHQISSYMNSTQRLNADKVRLLQLIEKGFQLAAEEQHIYCAIINYFPLPQTVAELESWRLVMRKIIVQNRELRAYKELWFDDIFMSAWLEAASRIEKYTIHYLWPLLVESKPTNKSLGLVTGLRLIIKCLVQWRARPVPVDLSLINKIE